MIWCVNRQCALQKKKNMRLAAAFCLFMGTSPINFGLLGKTEINKIKTTAKLKARARYKRKKKYAPSCSVLPIHGDIAY
jgi:hypothetical protein